MFDPLIHVGLHKTGTTWLQENLFCNAEAGYLDLADEMGRKALLDLMVRVQDVGYSVPDAQRAFASRLEAAAAAGLVPVLTHERFSGYPPAGSADRTLIAQRFADTFENPRVLLILREQTSLIDSMYGQYIADGGHLSLKRFLNGSGSWIGRMPRFSLETFEFDRLISYYFDLFGKDRVLVLPYELMRRDIAAFARRIAEFTGAPDRPVLPITQTNTRRPMLMQATRRIANGLLSRNELSDHGIVGIESLPGAFRAIDPVFRKIVPRKLDRSLATRQTRKVREAVGTHYVASNQRASELIGEDLASYGYQA